MMVEVEKQACWTEKSPDRFCTPMDLVSIHLSLRNSVMVLHGVAVVQALP